MVNVVLCIGSNCGDRAAYIRAMLDRLRLVLKGPLKISSCMETEPVDVPEPQQWYYNCLICGTFDGTPRHLLKRCQTIENALGRARPSPRAVRTADIDILLFGGMRISEHNLVIPHPEILNRRFCLEGLRELVPDYEIPGTGKCVSELYNKISGRLRQQRIIMPDIVAGIKQETK